MNRNQINLFLFHLTHICNMDYGICNELTVEIV